MALKMFGGTMTIEEFRDPPEKEYVLQAPPVLYVIPDEQVLLARSFGPASSMPPAPSQPPLSDAHIVDLAPRYHVDKVTVAERRKRKRAADLQRMGVKIKKL
jgi:hypothetical protein